MSDVKVYDAVVNPNSINNLSDQLFDAVGFYLIAPDVTYDVQVDMGVQIEFSSSLTRLVNIGTFEVNTEELYILPEAIRQLSNKKYLALFSTFEVRLEVWASYSDSCACQAEFDNINDRIDTLDGKINYLTTTNTGIVLNQIAQNTAIGLLSGGLGVALAPYTAGASLAIPTAVEPVLISGTGALLGLPGI